jgi:hypothetical protein
MRANGCVALGCKAMSDTDDNMVAVQIFGRVHPAGLTVDLHAPQIKYSSDDGTLTAEIDVKVVKSEICVSWTTADYRRDTLLAIWAHSRKLATALVDLVVFRMGAAATVIMDRYQDHTGHSDVLSFVEPRVKGISTLLDSDTGLLSVFSVIADEQHLMTVLEDLISGLWSQDHKIVNCARSIEAIRQLIAGYHLEPDAQWPIFRRALNVDRSYLGLIMDLSKSPRHGKKDSAPAHDVDAIMERTWTLIYRFFYYRLGGNTDLDKKRFPVLSG